MVVGLAHLHELGFVDRDLRPGNVLISCDNSLCAKICDQATFSDRGRGRFYLGPLATGKGYLLNLKNYVVYVLLNSITILRRLQNFKLVLNVTMSLMICCRT